MIEIVLPFPSADLNPNRKNGRHWGATHASKTKARDAAYFLTMQAQAQGGKVTAPRTLELVYIAPDKRRRDLDNLLASSKQNVDGICLALGIDDHVFDEVTIKRGYRKNDGALIVRVA